MGFLFRKRLKILPGIWLNLSKRGISTSIGGKGLTVNLKDGKTRTTVGIPGSGLSYRSTSTNTPPKLIGMPVLVLVLIVVIVVVAVFILVE
jgi:hypothetical protein